MKRMEKEFQREKAYNSLARPGSNEFIMVLDHLKPDFNIGKIIRSADAFGCQEIYLIGIPFFSPNPSKGSFRHVPVKFFESFAEAHRSLAEIGYTTYVFEPDGTEILGQAHFPKKSAFVMGHEEYGISFDKADYPDIKSVAIPQFGKVQSLNVSIAASISMYEYVRQHPQTKSTDFFKPEIPQIQTLGV